MANTRFHFGRIWTFRNTGPHQVDAFIEKGHSGEYGGLNHGKAERKKIFPVFFLEIRCIGVVPHVFSKWRAAGPELESRAWELLLKLLHGLQEFAVTATNDLRIGKLDFRRNTRLQEFFAPRRSHIGLCVGVLLPALSYVLRDHWYPRTCV